MGTPITMSQERLAEYRKESRAADGDKEFFRPNLPWPIIRFEQQSRSYINKDGESVTVRDERTYRFFSAVESVRHTNDRTGFTWSDIQYDSPYWSSLMVLGLYSGLAPVNGRLPMGLYTIPVSDFPGQEVDPLAWAVNPPSSPKQRKAARMDIHRGMRPQLMFWASALVDEPDNEGGVRRYIAVVQMKKNQAEKMADKWESFVNMARLKGSEAKMAGIPIHAWEVRGSDKGYDLDLRRADGDKIDLVSEYEAPDHDLLAESVRLELDRFLTENNSPIAGFPNKGDHEDDGWKSATPACMGGTVTTSPQRQESPGGLDEFADIPFTKMSNRDLIELLQGKGQKPPRNASRERLISMCEDIEDELAVAE